jgi:hypothetical protein
MEKTKTTINPVIERMKEFIGEENIKHYCQDELVIAYMICAEQLKDESNAK